MTTRAGFVALIGEPNAGKSTLTNTMVGAKVSIVTHKVQTTRTRIRGVAMQGETQIVFVDTPGLFQPRRRLDRAMVAAAWGGDVCCRPDAGAARPCGSVRPYVAVAPTISPCRVRCRCRCRRRRRHRRRRHRRGQAMPFEGARRGA